MTVRGIHCGLARGYSLIELLLTLTLLTAVAAMAWPVVQRQFDNYRLRTAADMIRTEWCLARIEAMRTGCVYTFRHSVDGKRFHTEPQLDEAAPAAPAANAASDAVPQPAAEEAPQPTATHEESAQLATKKALPDGVGFGASEPPTDPETGDLDSMLKPEDASPPDWSEPIFFYPDGTTSDAQLLLKNEHGRGVEVSLRGLTGTVDVGEVLSLEE